MENPIVTNTDDEEYRRQRIQDLAAISNCYPHEFATTCDLSKFRQTYEYLKNDEIITEKTERIAGRIQTIRSASNKLFFVVIESDNITLQVLANAKYYPDSNSFNTMKRILRRADIIDIVGHPTRSSKGELSILPQEIQLLAPCLHSIPKTADGLVDDHLRFSRRYLDFMVHPDRRDIIKTRSVVNKFIRNYLDDHGFFEVETPIISVKSGGANARPFITHHNDLKCDMFMRVAPELYLKQMVIGGLERVYELGKQFRNENMDNSHNPEFTSLEVYQSYADYKTMITLTTELFSGLALLLCGGYKFDYTMVNYTTGEKQILHLDFTPPFNVLDIRTDLEKYGDFVFPADVLADLSSEKARQFLINLCQEKNINCSDPKTTPRLLDKLIGEFLEPRCMERPTFIMNHFQIMSPLAKYHRENPVYTERFELFIAGKEFANAYTELNDPAAQRKCFERQAADKASGDVEAQPVDNDYITALEYGLCPTAGLGIGIDRLIMLLTNQSAIKEVISFRPC